MDKRLHLLETLHLQGDDGQHYVVQGFEHLVRIEGAPDSPWEPTGKVEYRLSTGERIDVDRAGGMRVASTGVALPVA